MGNNQDFDNQVPFISVGGNEREIKKNKRSKRIIFCLFGLFLLVIGTLIVSNINENDHEEIVLDEGKEEYYDVLEKEEESVIEIMEEEPVIEPEEEDLVIEPVEKESYMEVNPEVEYIIEDSDKNEIQISDIEEFSIEELRIARNEIYARHGLIFQPVDLKEHFGKTSWYEGTKDSVPYSNLNSVEQTNVGIIKNIEEQLNNNKIFKVKLDDITKIFVENGKLIVQVKAGTLQSSPISWGEDRDYQSTVTTVISYAVDLEGEASEDCYVGIDGEPEQIHRAVMKGLVDDIKLVVDGYPDQSLLLDPYGNPDVEITVSDMKIIFLSVIHDKNPMFYN